MVSLSDAGAVPAGSTARSGVGSAEVAGPAPDAFAPRPPGLGRRRAEHPRVMPDAEDIAGGDGVPEAPVRIVRSTLPAPDGGRPVRVTAYPDGPVLVRGPFAIVGQDGVAVRPRRRTVALCRCGRSRRMPLCDGTHKVVGFRTAEGRPRPAGGGAPPPASPRA